jgi:hypothetical protein
MERIWLILLGSLAVIMLLFCSPHNQAEPFADAGQAEYDDEDDEEGDAEPLTTEPDTRKAPKQKSTLPAAPVVAEGEKLKAPKAKPNPVIKANVAEVKKIFKVQKKKHTGPTKYIDKNAIIFTPRRMLCMPSTSGFQCLYQ